jgi:uncharacterized phiE125 gp8 family phage protein
MAEPLTIEEIVQHLDVVRDDQDDMLFGMGVAAREWVESYTGLSFDENSVTQTFSGFDRLGSLLAFPDGDEPEVRIDYLDAAGEPVQITTARMWRAVKPARLLPPAGAQWPADAVGPIAVTVTGIPFSLKAAMLLIVGNLYANRESTVTGITVADTGAVENLCRPYRMPVIG